MSDYTKQIDWVARGTTAANCLAADHDTELAAIAVAIATKTENVPSAVAGNISKQTSGGKLADTGIAASLLAGTTSSVQDQIDAGLDVVATPDNHIRVGNWFLTNQEDGLAEFDLDGLTSRLWTTIGPTGNGATEWAALDVVPSEAGILIFQMHVKGLGTSADELNSPSSSLWHSVPSHSSDGQENSNKCWYLEKSVLKVGAVYEATSTFMLPCTTDQRIALYWSQGTYHNNVTANLSYRGFITS